MSQLNFQPLADSLLQKPLTSSRTPARTLQRDSAGCVLLHFSGHTIQRHLSSRVSPATVLVTAGHHYTVARGCHLAFTTLLTCHVTQAFVTPRTVNPNIGSRVKLVALPTWQAAKSVRGHHTQRWTLQSSSRGACTGTPGQGFPY